MYPLTVLFSNVKGHFVYFYCVVLSDYAIKETIGHILLTRCNIPVSKRVLALV